MQHDGEIPVLDGARVERNGMDRAGFHGAYKFPGIGLGTTLGVYSNSLQNMVIGLYRRVLYKYDKEQKTYKPRIVPSVEMVDKRLLRFQRKFTRRSFVPVRCGLRDYPLLYTGGKRKIYERAVESLERDSLKPKDYQVNAFVKVEATKLNADPRVIQTRSPRFHASLGRFLKLNEKSFYYGVDGYFGEKTITKGLNADEVGQLIQSKFESFSNPVAIGLDASRFDRSVSIPVLQYVHGIYRRILGHDDELETLLRAQIRNFGRGYALDGRVKYKVDGGIMSGDVDTSLKGCLIMCSLVASWLEHTGVKAKVLNNGDDCVVFMERHNQYKFMDGLDVWFGQLGFDIVAEQPVYEIEHVEFCQARPVVSGDGTYVMCRNPVVASVKDSICRLPIQSVDAARAWAGSVYDCGMAMAGDMPIFSAYYPVYGRYAGSMRMNWMYQHSGYANGLVWFSRRMKGRVGVSDMTRVSFWRAWDIAPHEQRAIEDYYATLGIGQGFEGPIENLPQTSFQPPESVCYLSHGSKTQ